MIVANFSQLSFKERMKSHQKAGHAASPSSANNSEAAIVSSAEQQKAATELLLYSLQVKGKEYLNLTKLLVRPKGLIQRQEQAINLEHKELAGVFRRNKLDDIFLHTLIHALKAVSAFVEDKAMGKTAATAASPDKSNYFPTIFSGEHKERQSQIQFVAHEAETAGDGGFLALDASRAEFVDCLLSAKNEKWLQTTLSEEIKAAIKNDRLRCQIFPAEGQTTYYTHVIAEKELATIREKTKDLIRQELGKVLKNKSQIDTDIEMQNILESDPSSVDNFTDEQVETFLEQCKTLTAEKEAFHKALTHYNTIENKYDMLCKSAVTIERYIKAYHNSDSTGLSLGTASIKAYATLRGLQVYLWKQVEGGSLLVAEKNVLDKNFYAVTERHILSDENGQSYRKLEVLTDATLNGSSSQSKPSISNSQLNACLKQILENFKDSMLRSSKSILREWYKTNPHHGSSIDEAISDDLEELTALFDDELCLQGNDWFYSPFSVHDGVSIIEYINKLKQLEVQYTEAVKGIDKQSYEGQSSIADKRSKIYATLESKKHALIALLMANPTEELPFEYQQYGKEQFEQLANQADHDYEEPYTESNLALLAIQFRKVKVYDHLITDCGIDQHAANREQLTARYIYQVEHIGESAANPRNTQGFNDLSGQKLRELYSHVLSYQEQWLKENKQYQMTLSSSSRYMGLAYFFQILLPNLVWSKYTRFESRESELNAYRRILEQAMHDLPIGLLMDLKARIKEANTHPLSGRSRLNTPFKNAIAEIEAPNNALKYRTLTVPAEQLSGVLAERDQTIDKLRQALAQKDKELDNKDAVISKEKTRAEQEKNRAEQEKNRAEQEKNRAEQEKVRADNAQAELSDSRTELGLSQAEVAAAKSEVAKANTEMEALKARLHKFEHLAAGKSQATSNEASATSPPSLS